MSNRRGFRVTGLLGAVALIAGSGVASIPILGLGVPSAAAGTACTAGPLTVTSNLDTGANTLRAAFAALSATTGGTICIDTTQVTTSITLASSLNYSGTGAVTIDGNGATVQATTSFGSLILMSNGSPGLLTINALTLTGGINNGFGGAIATFGAVTVTGSTITNNQSTAASTGGGGIATGGAVTVTGSTIANNHTTGTGSGGGGIAAGAR